MLNTRKGEVKKSGRNRYYHVQHNKYVEYQDDKMYLDTNQFPEFQFLGPHNKPHGVCGLGKHYHMSFDTKLGHETCEMCRIPCVCTLCTSILDQPFIQGFIAQQQPHYKPIQDCT